MRAGPPDPRKNDSGRIVPGIATRCPRCGREVYDVKLARGPAGHAAILVDRRPAAGLRTRDMSICAIYPFHPADCRTRLTCAT